MCSILALRNGFRLSPLKRYMNVKVLKTFNERNVTNGVLLSQTFRNIALTKRT